MSVFVHLSQQDLLEPLTQSWIIILILRLRLLLRLVAEVICVESESQERLRGSWSRALELPCEPVGASAPGILTHAGVNDTTCLRIAACRSKDTPLSCAIDHRESPG